MMWDLLMLLNTIIILVDSHKRFWISEYQPLEITIPPYWYQKLVVDYLDVLFYKLELINKENKKLEEYVELSKKKITFIAILVQTKKRNLATLI